MRLFLLLLLGSLGVAGAYGVPSRDMILVHPQAAIGNEGNKPASTQESSLLCDGANTKHVISVGDYSAFLSKYAKEDPHHLYTPALASVIAQTISCNGFSYEVIADNPEQAVLGLEVGSVARFCNAQEYDYERFFELRMPAESSEEITEDGGAYSFNDQTGEENPEPVEGAFYHLAIEGSTTEFQLVFRNTTNQEVRASRPVERTVQEKVAPSSDSSSPPKTISNQPANTSASWFPACAAWWQTIKRVVGDTISDWSNIRTQKDALSALKAIGLALGKTLEAAFTVVVSPFIFVLCFAVDYLSDVTQVMDWMVRSPMSWL